MIALVVASAFADCTADRTDPVGVDNRFVATTAEYKPRAGAFYESTAVDPALAQLVEALSLSPADAAVARCSLVGFVYDWLDIYVRENGSMPAPRLTGLVTALYDKLAPWAPGPEQRASLAHWRSTNPLSFMMTEADSTTFRDDGDGLFLSRAGLFARTHEHGIRVSGPGDSLDFWLLSYGRSELLGGDPATWTIGSDGSAVFDRGSYVERWAAVSDGTFQETWTFPTRPPGTGPLRIIVWVDSAVISGHRDLTLVDARDRAWTYGNLVAVDTTGRALPAKLYAERDHIYVSIDDTDARWPITVSHRLTSH